MSIFHNLQGHTPLRQAEGEPRFLIPSLKKKNDEFFRNSKVIREKHALGILRLSNLTAGFVADYSKNEKGDVGRPLSPYAHHSQ